MTQQSVERLCFATSPAVKTFSSKFVDFFSLAEEEDRRRTDEEEEVEEGIVASGLHIPKCEEEVSTKKRERDLTREPQREIFLSLFFFVPFLRSTKREFFEKMKNVKIEKRDHPIQLATPAHHQSYQKIRKH